MSPPVKDASSANTPTFAPFSPSSKYLHIVGPPPLASYLRHALRASATYLPYQFVVHELAFPTGVGHPADPSRVATQPGLDAHPAGPAPALPHDALRSIIEACEGGAAAATFVPFDPSSVSPPGSLSLPAPPSSGSSNHSMSLLDTLHFNEVQPRIVPYDPLVCGWVINLSDDVGTAAPDSAPPKPTPDTNDTAPAAAASPAAISPQCVPAPGAAATAAVASVPTYTSISTAVAARAPFVVAAPLAHRVGSVGYMFVDGPATRRVNKQLLASLGLSGLAAGALIRGQHMTLPCGRIVTSDDVHDPPTARRAAIVMGDTACSVGMAAAVQAVNAAIAAVDFAVTPPFHIPRECLTSSIGAAPACSAHAAHEDPSEPADPTAEPSLLPSWPLPTAAVPSPLVYEDSAVAPTIPQATQQDPTAAAGAQRGATEVPAGADADTDHDSECDGDSPPPLLLTAVPTADRLAPAVRICAIVHEATFADAQSALARPRGHTTARAAGAFAAALRAEICVLSHFSARYTSKHEDMLRSEGEDGAASRLRAPTGRMDAATGVFVCGDSVDPTAAPCWAPPTVVVAHDGLQVDLVDVRQSS